MTAPRGTSGIEPVTAEGIHDSPPAKPPTLDGKWLKSRAESLMFRIGANVLYALAGIEVLGVNPFGFLSVWADDLAQRADDAYYGALNAQASANYANSMLISLTNAALPSDVPGGVSQLANFNGAGATNWGADFTRISSGPGAGGYGPNGSGHAVWTKSGGLQRAHYDRPNDPLTTDYQAVRVLLSSKPEGGNGGGSNVMRGRCNADQDTFVWARIAAGNNVAIGCTISGSVTTFIDDTVTWNAGDIWLLIIGTDVDEREFILKRNGNEILRYTDTADVSAMGTDYLYAGHTASCTSLFFQQYAPADCDVWSAADRQPTTLNI